MLFPTLQGKSVLIVDDDPQLLNLMKVILLQSQAQVYTADGGQDGLQQFYHHQPALVILDLMMPDVDSWKVCQQIRQLSNVPIIILTALDQDSHLVSGLNLGADDYLVKPVETQVFLARVEALLRRATSIPETPTPVIYSDDYLTVDLDRYQVLVRGQPVRLTAREYRLLIDLVQAAGRVRTFKQILESVWGWEFQESVDYVHTYISRLRRKLEPDPKNPRYFLTEYGIGYWFAKPGSIKKSK